jgi:hypothetical protein
MKRETVWNIDRKCLWLAVLLFPFFEGRIQRLELRPQIVCRGDDFPQSGKFIVKAVEHRLDMGHGDAALLEASRKDFLAGFRIWVPSEA